MAETGQLPAQEPHPTHKLASIWYAIYSPPYLLRVFLKTLTHMLTVPFSALLR
jgi:hypothetical protein